MRKAPPARKAAPGFSAEERAAMRERVRELKARPGDGEADLLAKVAAMPPPDRTLAQALHALVRSVAPQLEPRTWYGMPAYGLGDKVVCYFQSAHKFKARYATLGFSDKARLDDGAMWPTAFALQRLGPEERARITALLQAALGGLSA